MADRQADDPRFHHEIWSGPGPEQKARTPSVYYVENHNGQCGYAELAHDFKMAAEASIRTYRAEELSNWISPIAHLVRHTIELSLKALLQTTIRRGNTSSGRLLSSHSLQDIWQNCRAWLEMGGYRFREDTRLATAEWFITTLHEIDPSGDLFRFGISSRSAFGKQKSYDRIGIRLDIMEEEFQQTFAFLCHWEAVPLREIIKEEMEWSTDPYFDANEFPRIGR